MIDISTFLRSENSFRNREFLHDGRSTERGESAANPQDLVPGSVLTAGERGAPCDTCHGVFPALFCEVSFALPK